MHKLKSTGDNTFYRRFFPCVKWMLSQYFTLGIASKVIHVHVRNFDGRDIFAIIFAKLVSLLYDYLIL